MYRSSILFLAAFAVFVGNITPQDPLLTSLIVGGQDADISDYPYTVSVRIRDEHVCGGCIIADNVLLTAAHCINEGAWTLQDYSIQYSLTRIGRTGNLINVTNLIPHENYRLGAPDYDVGLIILASDIPLAQIISLATVRPPAGTNAVIVGWGRRNEDGRTSTVLQSVTVQIVSTEVCQRQYSADGITITDRSFCAGIQEGGKDSCQGDSGGPLVVDDQLVGIVEGGFSCGNPNEYSIYSDVAALREWILDGSFGK